MSSKDNNIFNSIENNWDWENPDFIYDDEEYCDWEDDDLLIDINDIKKYILKSGQYPTNILIRCIPQACECSKEKYFPGELSSVELDIPIILIRKDSRIILIDGYHRVTVAKDRKIKLLPCYIIDWDMYLYNKKNNKVKKIKH